MQVLVRGRLHIAAICTGLARRLIDESVAFALDRRQFGQRIADFQLIQAMLADSQAEYLAARSMMLETARRYDQQLASAAEVACCKLFASEMVGRVADRAVQIHGGTGYMRDCPVERLYRDVRLFRIYEGTSQIQQLIIARDLIRRAESGRA
jgi:acyl-CoA dehydrogenase